MSQGRRSSSTVIFFRKPSLAVRVYAVSPGWGFRDIAGMGRNPWVEFWPPRLDSAFIEDAHRVEVSATITSNKRRELALEAIVGKFTEMEGVICASLRLNPQAS